MLLTLFVVQLLTIAGLAYCFVLLRRTLERQSAAETERFMTAGLEELLQDLQASAEQSIQDLARQKTALQRLLREADKRIQLLPEEQEQPAPAPAGRAGRRKAAQRPAPAGPRWQEEALHLAREGLSVPAIARQLKAGVEEVRLVLSRARAEEQILPPTA
ncbi:MAG TPA: hypothetical protein VIO14_07265 [Dehalococcoidia bacterium]